MFFESAPCTGLCRYRLPVFPDSCFCLALVLLFCATAFAGESHESRVQAVETELKPKIHFVGDQPASITQRLAAYRVPGMSLTVIEDFSIAWTRYYGFADREQGRPVDPTTLFQAGSISKALTAAATLRLAEQGLLDRDLPVNAYLQRWQLPDATNTAQQPVTVDLVLCHGAGLNLHGFDGYRSGHALPSMMQMLNGDEPANHGGIAVVHRPGRAFVYSGGGYLLLQCLLEDRLALPFDEILAREVLEPLGMRQSSFANPPPPDWTGYLASGYQPGGDPVLDRYRLFPEQAAAGLWTTSPDLARFAIDLAKSVKAGNGKVLNQASARAMARCVLDESMGLGLFLKQRGEHMYVSHGGRTVGFVALFEINPQTGDGAVVMINGDHYDLLEEVVNSVARVYQWPEYLEEAQPRLPIPADLQKRVAGRYRYSADLLIKVRAEGDQLFFAYSGAPETELIRTGENLFQRRNSTTLITFPTDKSGQVSLAFYLPEGGMQVQRRMAPDEKIPRELLWGNQPEAALAAYQQALREFPGDPGVNAGDMAATGRYLVEQGDVAAGRDLLWVTAHLFPEDEKHWLVLGRVCRENGDIEGAVSAYRRAYALPAGSTEAGKALRDLLGRGFKE